CTSLCLSLHPFPTRRSSDLVLGGAGTAITFVMLALTQELWQFYLFFFLHAITRQMMFFLPFQSLISQWFERRRGVALSLLGSGRSEEHTSELQSRENLVCRL